MHEPEQAHSTTSEMTRCVVCKESIRQSARKCVHCESYQGWRRHIAVGDAFLALLVALVSVLSLSLPIFREIYSSNNSEVRVTFQDAQGRYLFMIASNTGTKPGTVGRANLVITGLEGASFPEGRAYLSKGPLGSLFEGIVPLTADGWDKEKNYTLGYAVTAIKE